MSQRSIDSFLVVHEPSSEDCEVSEDSATEDNEDILQFNLLYFFRVVNPYSLLSLCQEGLNPFQQVPTHSNEALT